MDFSLIRFAYGSSATLGRLSLYGRTFYKVERPWLGNRPFESCIPEGLYLCEPYSSAKYPNVWELKKVPDRSTILIHAANYASDVQGGIGIGMPLAPGAWWVTQSRKAMKELRGVLLPRFELSVTHYISE
ncbi:DUF5675 family protein [Microbulbifer sp. SSSA007]|uniref:DUF5675 family protein n=1 Tax=Microbulbifer sp. SSSA007 TaxID=3243379 RepID=UPI0040392649